MRRGGVVATCLLALVLVLTASVATVAPPDVCSPTAVTGTAALPPHPGGLQEPSDVREMKTQVAVLPLNESTWFGGDDEEWVEDVAVLPDGTAFAVGWTHSAYFPTTPGANKTTPDGGGTSYEGWVTRFGPTGEIEACTLFGGADDDYIRGVDTNGTHVWICGWTDSDESADHFPVTPDAFDSTYAANFDGFVAVFDYNLTDLVFCSYLGGNEADRLFDIALDSAGSAWVVGSTTGATYPTAGTPVDGTKSGGTNRSAVVSAFNLSGLHYSSFLDGLGKDEARSVVVRETTGPGSVRLGVSGTTTSRDFPVTAGAYDEVHKSAWGSAWFLAEHLTASWSGSVAYATFLGQGLEDPSDTVYYQFPALHWSGLASEYTLAGSVQTSTWPVTSGASQLSLAGGWDGYVATVAPVGGGATDLHFSSFHGGSQDDHLRAVMRDSESAVIALGSTRSEDIAVTGNGAVAKSQETYRDVLVVRWTPPSSYTAVLNYSGAHSTGEAWSEAQAAGLLVYHDDPLALVTSSPAGAGDQDLVRTQYRLPTTPVLDLVSESVPDEPDEHWRFVVNATPYALKASLNGSAVSHVRLLVQADGGSVSGRYADQDPTVSSVYEVRVEANSSGLYAWTLEVVSDDNGRRSYSGWANVSGPLTAEEEEAAETLAEQIVQETYGISLADYWWYALLGLIALVILYVAGKFSDPQYGGQYTKGIIGVVASAIIFGATTMILGGTWTLLEQVLIWPALSLWAYMAVQYRQRGLFGGLAAVTLILAVYSGITGAHWGYILAWSIVSAGSAVAVIPKEKFRLRGKEIQLKHIALIIEIAGALLTLLMAVLPLVSEQLTIQNLLNSATNSTAPP